MTFICETCWRELVHEPCLLDEQQLCQECYDEANVCHVCRYEMDDGLKCATCGKRCCSDCRALAGPDTSDVICDQCRREHMPSAMDEWRRDPAMVPSGKSLWALLLIAFAVWTLIVFACF